MFTLMVGELDHVPGGPGDVQPHKISTRFFGLVGPLIPFESLCVTYETYEQVGARGTRHTWAGEQVRLNAWSILLGYLRVWLAVAIFALPFVLYWGKSVHGYMFVPSGYALLALVLVLVVPGLVTRGRTRRLAVLRRVTGLGCDPRFRFAWRRDEACGELMQRVADSQLPSSAEALMDRVPSMNREQLELVFAAAWYQSGNWRALREAAWARLAQLA